MNQPATKYHENLAALLGLLGLLHPIYDVAIALPYMTNAGRDDWSGEKSDTGMNSEQIVSTLY